MAEVLNVLAVLSVFLVLSSNNNRIYKDAHFPDRPGNKETDSGDLESHLTNLENVLDSNTSTTVDDVLHTEERYQNVLIEDATSLQSIFEMLDANRNDHIQLEEWSSAAGTMDEFVTYLKMSDTDGDAMLSWEEFKNIPTLTAC